MKNQNRFLSYPCLSDFDLWQENSLPLSGRSFFEPEPRLYQLNQDPAADDGGGALQA